MVTAQPPSPLVREAASMLASLHERSGLSSRFTQAELDGLHAGAMRLYQAGELPEAATLISILRLCRPLEGRYAESAGHVARKRGDFGDAVLAFSTAWRLDPGNLRAAWQLTECLLLAGRREEAAAALERLREAAQAQHDTGSARRAGAKLDMLRAFA